MIYLDHLPADIARFIRTRYIAEFATVTKAGVPIDTPLVPFTSEDLTTIDSATGLAYPAKADRIRANPKIGMLFEGRADEPVVSIAALGAVRDRDLQTNLERYLAEQILTPTINPKLVDYDTETRPAIWYFTRIIMCATPVHIRWWVNQAAMDGPPQEWRAADAAVPASDPAPTGAHSKASWDLPRWQDLARGALERKAAAHLCLVDAAGFPLTIRARDVHGHESGFRLIMPKWLPWSNGKASVSFQGLETFIGEATIIGSEALVRVERAQPIHPLLAGGPLNPDPVTKRSLMERIQYELDRRGGLPLPRMPAHAPEPTAGAKLRTDDAYAFPGVGDQ
jgi:hypothetical protein